MKRAIIFGANGQDGFYLSKILQKKKYQVIMTSRSGNKSHKLNVANYLAVKKIIENEQPQLIFNFAATSSTSHKFLFDNLNTIVKGTVNILEACRSLNSSAKIFIAGSGLQFLNLNKMIKVTDNLDFKSAYVCARNSALFYTRYYRSLGLNVYYGFLFNHESSRRPRNHLTWRLFRDSKKYAKNRIQAITIINEKTKKEWAHAEDVCNEIYRFVSKGKASDAIIGTGEGLEIKDYISLLIKSFSSPENSESIKFNREKHAKLDYKKLISSPSQFKTINNIPKIILDLKKNACKR